VRKRTSLERETLTSFFASASASIENLIIAEYVFIAGTSLPSVSGVGVCFVGVPGAESTAAKKSRDSKVTESGR
jgi:hypothetical protein